MDKITPFRVVDVMERAWQAERSGRRIVWLVAGEPDFGTPRQVVSAAQVAVAEGDVHYTPPLGIEPLRDAISQYYADRFDAAVSPEQVVITTGASAALLMSFGATIDVGQRVVMADPGYPCNINLLELCGGSTTRVPVGPSERYQLSAKEVANYWDAKTKAVLVGSPSNPTGSVVEPDELVEIVELAKNNGGLAIVDEVYGELVYGRERSTVLSRCDDVFVINSFSKTFGMTGWRLGWMVCPPWAIDAVRALAQNVYISPPMPSQRGALAALTPEVYAIVEERRLEFERRRDLLVAGLRSIGFDVPLVPDGGFYVYAGCAAFSSDSAELARDLLDGADVAVAPGNDFGDHDAHRHLRFSYTTSLGEIEAGLEKIATYLLR